MTQDDKRNLLWLLLFLAAVSGLRLLVIGTIPFSPDEAYYWTWSRRPAICYYDQPGMIAWVDWLFALPFAKTTVFTARLAAVALSAVTTLVLFLAHREHTGDSRQALWFAALFSLLPFAWIYGILIIHDVSLFPWLALSVWALVRLARRGGRPLDWLFLSVALTGAMYAKLSAVMLAWGLVLYMTWSPKGRRWWKRPAPYIAGLVSALLYMPAVAWNVKHDFITLRAVSELTAGGADGMGERLRYLAEYVTSQVGLFSPLLGLVMVWALATGFRHALRRPDDDRTVLPLCLALPVALYFLQQSLRSHVFGNWPNVMYVPLAMLAFSRAWDRIAEGGKGGRFLWRFVLAGIVANVLFMAAATLHMQYDVFGPFFRGLEDKYELEDRIDWRLDLDFRGWDEMAELVEENRGDVDFILARRYQTASMLEFMLPDRPFVECFNDGRRGNQWDLWSRLDERAGQDALYVDYKRLPEEMEGRCRSVEVIEKPYILGDPELYIKRFYVYKCRGWTPPPKDGGPAD